MKTIQFTYKRSAPAPLLEVLAHALHLSRKRTKRLLDSRSVLVNNRRVWMAKHTLAPGDIVTVAPDASPRPRRPLPVIVETDHFLVVNKPPGSLSTGEHSIEPRLRREHRLRDLAAAHRLDRDTSGCLLLAKHHDALLAARGLFRDRQVSKVYHVIVEGAFTDDRSLTKPIKGRQAVSHVRVLDAGRAASHLLVKLHTGRTHQIRRHLAAAHHCVVGDRHYAAGRKTDPRLVNAPRQMLHAAQLGFLDPFTSAYVKAKAPLPRDFRQCLRSFKLT